MPLIDLKFADIFIKDGTVNAATTTLTAAVTKGDPVINKTSVIPVTATTGLAVGDGITLGTSLEYYTILGISTLNVTIAPPLTQAFASGAAVAGVSNMLEVKIGEGTLTYSEKRAMTYILNRGHIYGVKLGDDAPMEVSLQFLWEFLRAPAGTPPSVEEALKQIGAASDWVSTDPDPCNPYCVDISICYIPPCGDTERIDLQFFRWEELNHDLKGATCDVRGNCNIAMARVVHGTS
jgi:hypothetical protein